MHDRHLRSHGLLQATGNTEQAVQDMQEAVQLDPDACSSQLPWQDIPDDAFCSLMAALLPEHQAFRVMSAAMRVLRLRLTSLSMPAPQRLLSTLAVIGDGTANELSHHFEPDAVHWRLMQHGCACR
jgi:hypothetical protein